MRVWAFLVLGCVEVDETADAWTLIDEDEVGEADTALGWWDEPTLVGWQPHEVVEPLPDDQDAHAEFWPFLGVPRPAAAVCAPAVDDCMWEDGAFRVRWQTVPHIDPSWRDTQVVPLVSIDEGPWRMPGAMEDWAFMAYPMIRYEGVPHEGCTTARLGAYSGGAHCCDTTWFLTSCPEGETVTRVEGGDVQGEWGAGFADLDEDGTFELFQGDVSDAQPGAIDGVRCLRGRWHAPVIWRSMTWSPAGWQVNGPDRRFADFYRREIDWLDANDVRDEEDIYDMSNEASEISIATGMHLYLAGADDDALQRTLVTTLATPMGAEDVVFDGEDPAVVAALVNDSEALEARRDDLMLDCVHVAPELAHAIAVDAAAFGPARVATIHASADAADARWPWP